MKTIGGCIIFVAAGALVAAALTSCTSGPPGVRPKLQTQRAALLDSSNLDAVSSLATMLKRGEILGVSTESNQIANAMPISGSAQYAFDVPQIDIDIQIAVGKSHVCMTQRSQIGCFTKAGNPVSLGKNEGPGLVSAFVFFGDSGLPFGQHTMDHLKDGRIVYDSAYDRFVAIFQERDFNPAGGAISHLHMAVSKSGDPRDGWYTYLDDPQFDALNGQDYDWIGQSKDYVLFTNRMQQCTGVAGEPSWSCGNTAFRQLMYPKSALYAGLPYTRIHWRDDSTGGAPVPANDEDASASQTAFWVDRVDDTTVRVYGFRPGIDSHVKVSSAIDVQSGPAFATKTLFSGAVNATNFSQTVQSPPNAVLRGGKLVFAANVGHDWGDGQRSSIHLLELDVTNFWSNSVTKSKDRIFGKANSSDPVSQIWDYGMPGVATLGDGTVVVGSIRVTSLTAPEHRATIWPPAQADVSPSELVNVIGNNADYRYHMPGAAADPSGTSAYLAQRYIAASGAAVRVVKELGTTLPDLIATNLTSSVAQNMQSGVPFTVNVSVTNQGDGAAPATTAALYINLNYVITPSSALLTNFTVPALGPGASTTIPVSATVPVAWGGLVGQWFIGVRLNIGPGSQPDEYNYKNNLNPFQSGNRGNLSVYFPATCPSGLTREEVFLNGMVGCGGSTPWYQRTCGTGQHVCTALEWIANKGPDSPTGVYWTDDSLRYHSDSGGPGGTFRCSVETTSYSASNPQCGWSGYGGNMLVCPDGGVDKYGNNCYWSKCGMNADISNEHFGGCPNKVNRLGYGLAGTLCCLGSGPGPEPNECGGNTVLSGSVGAKCGCTGTYACDGHDALTCVGETRNECGGCSALAHPIDGRCNAKGTTCWTCTGPDSENCQACGN